MVFGWLTGRWRQPSGNPQYCTTLEASDWLQSCLKIFPDCQSGHEFCPRGSMRTPYRRQLTRNAWFEGEPERFGRKAGKPPYRVPLMAEVAAIPWNGFKVASTFSGCGGS